ncbi:bifunctional RNase H/acid phosphatase [Nocardiopsis sp. RSe5-2]|uniref:Bifunctional RNase H/acid phosphatase n=1 Tax=Nocardiopsis endophytica TaxID=3018445 RepID=A0ABT4U822_9ACTN|nr:bifunctional RNase H/acid phosphatase [Nocardiopsis endophytica]MDA2813107.1 bifunctional RNase H/acid phosphatase [Nocardiopsis endophytica]
MGRALIVEADGGSRGNPGPAGFGALVRDAGTGEVLAEAAEALGTATNNVAEYRGLIAGLEAAARIDAQASVVARMDSKLVVEQMSGRWKVKHPAMRPLAERAKEAAAGLGSVVYEWVPRADNAHADALANEAMDAAAEGRPVRLGGAGGVGGDGVGGEAAPTSSAGDTAPPAARAGTASSAGSGWSAEPDTAPTRLVLLRHGETPMSVERRFAGTGDIELTETGRDQARRAARALAGEGFEAVVASPLRRTMDTARIVAEALGLEVEPEEGLRETDFGEWEGMTFGEVRERRPEDLARWLADPEEAPPGGESLAAAVRRAGEGRDKVAARHRGRKVLVVTHVTPIKALVAQALGAPVEALYRMHVDVASVTRVDVFSDGPMLLRSFNDTHHLEG